MAEKTLTWWDRLAISISLLLAGGGVVSFYRFADHSLLIRTVGLVGAVLFALLLFLITHPGKELRRFISEAYLEMRKVVWPSRQEVVQTTLIIVAFVAAMGLFFWALDSLFFWGVGVFI